MANEVKKANREAVRKAILARRDARKQEKTAQYAKMRETAKSPAKFAKVLDDLVAKTARQAYSMEALRENLGLVKAAKEAPARVRIAAAKNYGKRFVRVAEEQPDVLADALREAYKGLDEEAAAIELAAEALDIDLGATPVEKAFSEEGKNELELGEEKGEEKAVVVDADKNAPEEGPFAEAKEEAEEEPSFEEEPEEKEAAVGSDAFTTDRNPSGDPKSPAKAQIPQSKGEAFKQSSGEQQKPTTQKFNISEHSEGADKFVKEIPQSQGKSEGNTASQKTAMGRKEYVLIADAIRSSQLSPEQQEAFARHIAPSLRADNGAFLEDRFVDYVKGTGGPRGGTPKGTPRKKAPVQAV